MLPPLTIPPAELPRPLEGYGLPTNAASLLPWSFVSERMASARFYWLSTAADLTAGGFARPHAVPLWGIWYNDRLQVDGSNQTRWARALRANPNVAIHLPDPESVVIIEGVAEMLADEALTAEEWAGVDSAFRTKYAVDWGSPYWVIHPRLVLAWDSAQLATMTRWRFASS